MILAIKKFKVYADFTWQCDVFDCSPEFVNLLPHNNVRKSKGQLFYLCINILSIFPNMYSCMST